MRLLLAVALICAVLTPAAHAELVGAIHEHTGYSDGEIGTTPADAFAAGRAAGLDFMASTEHGEILLPGRWAGIAEQAAAASDDAFTAIRGFEWTSDRSGHINVLFSAHRTSAYLDGGNLDVDAFWRWFTRPVSEGGGADGLAIFNHPGDKSLRPPLGSKETAGEDDPAYNWENFRHVPAADGRMVGLEVFNGGGEHLRFYAQALDRGWHVGAVGGEDEHGTSWAAPDKTKTVLLAADGAGIRAALEGRRMYALRSADAPRLRFAVDGAPMGSRLHRDAGAALRITATGAATLELVTSGGAVVATGDGALDVERPAAGGERWYYVRARQGDRVVSVSSPVWVTATDAARTWLAGDLHVHSCASHDVLCVPDTETSEPWTLGIPVRGRFAEASLRGLDFLAITDHNDTSSVADPGYGSSGVLGLPGYENSVHGHMQVLGVDAVLDNGDKSPAAMRRLIEEAHARGGVIQANHPGDGETDPFGGCDSVGTGEGLDWKYGYDVEVDTVEVLNATSPVQTAERFLDCLLDRGRRVGVTGGSDSHWALTAAVQGAGTPTTWIHTDDRTVDGLARALREGRTAVSKLPPALGGAPPTIEDEQGRVVIGESVEPGTRLVVRAPSGGLVSVRGTGVREVPVAPGGTVAFTAPDRGWARAVVTAAPEGEPCTPNGLPISTCPYDASILGLTSPVYVAPPDAPGPTAPAGPGPDAAPAPATGSAPNRATTPAVRTPRALVRSITLRRVRGGRARVAFRLSRSGRVELRLRRHGKTVRRIRLGRRAQGIVTLRLARGTRVQLLVDGVVRRTVA